MPKYNYVAMDQKGKETKGTLEVATQNEAITRVKEMGLFPTKIVEIDKAKEKADPKQQSASKAKKPGKKKGGGGINIKIPGLGGGSLDAGALPLGLAHGWKVLRPIAAGQTVKWSDVAVDMNNAAVKLRREMEARYREPQRSVA